MVNMCFFTVYRMSELAFQVFSHFLLSISTLKVGEGFPGGSVVKKSLANARDTGAIPDPGRSRMPQSNSACVPQLSSLCSGAREPQLRSSCATATEARPQQEKPQQRGAHVLQPESSPHCLPTQPQRCSTVRNK